MAHNFILQAEIFDPIVIGHVKIKRHFIQHGDFIIFPGKMYAYFGRQIILHADFILLLVFVFFTLFILQYNGIGVIFFQGQLSPPDECGVFFQHQILSQIELHCGRRDFLIDMHFDIDTCADHPRNISTVGRLFRRFIKILGIMIGQIYGFDFGGNPGIDQIRFRTKIVYQYAIFRIALHIGKCVIIHIFGLARLHPGRLPLSTRRTPANHCPPFRHIFGHDGLAFTPANFHIPRLNQEFRSGHYGFRLAFS